MTLRSSLSGFLTTTVAAGRANVSRSFGETKAYVSASESPRFSAASATSRSSSPARRGRRGSAAGSEVGTRSKPRTRATSSMRSTSLVTSGRNETPRTSALADGPEPLVTTGKPRRSRMRRGLVERHRHAEQRVEPRRAQRDRGQRRAPARARGSRPSRCGRPQARRAAPSARSSTRGERSEVDAALEAVARLGVQALTARRAAHATRREVRALEQHARRSGADLAVLAAHHARERRRGPRRRRSRDRRQRACARCRRAS